MPLSLAGGRVAAGFPSPADDFIEGQLDLNEYLIRRPLATFYLRVSGESMTGIGIYPGDLLIVDRAEEACHGCVVVAAVDNQLTVKRLYRKGKCIRLQAANPAYEDIELENGSELIVWGVVRAAVHQFIR